jgi:hypothetical protein
MKRFWARFVTVTALGCLLAAWALQALAYFPPLHASATFTYNSVFRTVYDNKLHKWQETTTQWGGEDVQVMDLKQHNGVISWIFRNGATFFVYYCVYDPDLAKYKEDMQGGFTSVSQLQVWDGVVAYVAGVPPSPSDPNGHPEFRYATYDPSKSAWQHKSYYYPGYTALQLITKDGVVVCHYTLPLPDNLTHLNFNSDIYDPMLGKWVGCVTGHSGDEIYLMYLNITNATIYYRYYGYNPEKEGYTWNQYSSTWMGGTDTNPMAYFVAQPKLGTSPMWVWFTDMSITDMSGGTTWNWNFDDNSSTFNRSPYHTFTSSGTFWVSQQISGPSGSNTYTQPIIVGYPTVLKKSLTGVLYLLLLED